MTAITTVWYISDILKHLISENREQIFVLLPIVKILLKISWRGVYFKVLKAFQRCSQEGKFIKNKIICTDISSCILCLY